MKSMSHPSLKGALEALLFVSSEPLKATVLSEVLDTSIEEVERALHELQQDYEQNNRGIRLREIARSWRLYSAPDYHEQVESLVLSWDKTKLTQAALETLAIVSYRQPITREGIRSIRGVNSDGVLASLIEKGYVREAGRAKDASGAFGAKTYRTTTQFLEHFGLSSLKDLPRLKDFAPSAEAKTFIKERLAEPQTSFVLETAPEDATPVFRGDELDVELQTITSQEVGILEEAFSGEATENDQ